MDNHFIASNVKRLKILRRKIILKKYISRIVKRFLKKYVIVGGKKKSKKSSIFPTYIMFSWALGKWKKINIKGALTVSGLEKSGYNREQIEKINIGKSVTSIKSGAFSDCSDLKSVTIPDSVTSVAVGAFYNCSSLTSFIVGAGNPSYKSVNGLLLSKNGKTLIAGINSDVTIPDSVTSIGDYAFYYCRGLTSVTIPDSVTSIENGAFYGCGGLTSVTIPSSVTSIRIDAFTGCGGLVSFTVSDGNTNYKSVNGLLLSKDDKVLVTVPAGLTGVTIPDSVIDIKEYAFSCNYKLKSVTIPDSVTSIGVGAFYGCGGLTSVTIPNSVTSIGVGAFYGCRGLTYISIDKQKTDVQLLNPGNWGLNSGTVIHCTDGDITL